MKVTTKGLRTFLLGVGLAVLVLGAPAALAGSGIGGVFNLGQGNSVNAQTSLSGSTAASELRVDNTSTSGGYGVRGSSAAASGVGVTAVNTGGGSALQAVVNNNSIPPLKVNSSAKVLHLNAAMLEGHPASDFLGCHNGGIWGHAAIDGTAASTTDFTTAGVDSASQFVCDPSIHGSNVLVQRISQGRFGVVFGDTNNGGFIGIGGVGGPLAQVTSQDPGKIVSTHGTVYQCAINPPPYVLCWDVRMTDAAANPADGSFTITIG
jgi:hypothetical protein